MFNLTAFENSRPDGIGVLEIVAGKRRASLRRFVPLRRTHLSGTVAGPLASLRVLHVYGFSREACNRPVEALYRFPLPGDAAVTGVRVRFGDVEIRTELKERSTAEEEYEAARAEGRQAALTTRESPDVFTLRIAGIRPDEDVEVETDYVQLARPEGAGWSLRVPLTTAPRYVREDEAGSRFAEGQPLALLRDPGHRFSLDLTFRPGRELRSPTHALQVDESGERTRVRLRDGSVVPDRDCLLLWEPEAGAAQPTLQVLVHRDAAAGQLYFLALASPPAESPGPQREPRSVVALVDHSGSMSGAKWEAADWAVTRFLQELSPEDRFALGLFHTSTRWLDRGLLPGSPEQVNAAIAFLTKNTDSGGTDLGVALEQALAYRAAAETRSRHMLIITDAEVTDEGRLLQLAGREARKTEGWRISLLCIDAAPNSLLVHELADRGRGSARFLTSDPGEEDITTALDEVLLDWAAPAYAGLTLEVDRPLASSDRRSQPAAGTGWSALDLGDLPAGRARWIAGHVPDDGSPELTFRLRGAGGVLDEARVPLDVETDLPALRALFAARRLLALEFLAESDLEPKELSAELERLGYDAAELSAGAPEKSLYRENAREGTRSAVRALLVREALAFGLASSETAFVATRSEAGETVATPVIIPNALPHGWEDTFVTVGAACAPPAGGAIAGTAMPRIGLGGGAPAPASAPPSAAMYDSGPGPSFVTAKRRAAAPAPGGVVLYSGVPRFDGGEAVLFSTGADPGPLSRSGRLVRLTVRFPGGSPAGLDPTHTLLLYCGDPTTPRARVRLPDLLRMGGTRPLNVTRAAGEELRLVLTGADQSWPANLALEVAVVWESG